MDLEGILQKEDLYDKESDLLWKFRVGGGTVDEFIMPLLRKLSDHLNLNPWGRGKREQIIMDSLKYPDHSYSIGRFMNGQGPKDLGKVLSDLKIGSLEWIFNYNFEEGIEYRPNWVLALERVKESLSLLNATPYYRNERIKFSADLKGPLNSSEVMEIFYQELNKYPSLSEETNYKNSKGDFYFQKPLEISAIIPSSSSNASTGATESYLHIIYKEDSIFYKEALEIVQETCEWVLSQKDPENYWLQ